MPYELNIAEKNQQFHVDLEKDLVAKQNGKFTFTIRINQTNVVDYVVTEYADSRKYLILKEVIIQELGIPSDSS